MSQQSGNLVHDDVLAKMDALLKKHHDALARGSVPEDFPVLTEVVKESEDVIPVLTEVVEVALEAVPAADFEADSWGSDTSPEHEISQGQFHHPHTLAPVSSQEYSPWSYSDEAAEQYTGGDMSPIDDMSARSAEMAADVPSSEICHPEPSQPEEKALPLSSEELNQLDRRILEMLEQRLPAHIVEAVDKALPVVLEEFAMELESMVRDAVAQELRQQLAELLRQGQHGDVPE